jgi:hypothetical protein
VLFCDFAFVWGFALVWSAFNSPFILIFALQRFLGFSERGKDHLLRPFMVKTKPSGSLSLLGARNCES